MVVEFGGIESKSHYTYLLRSYLPRGLQPTSERSGTPGEYCAAGGREQSLKVRQNTAMLGSNEKQEILKGMVFVDLSNPQKPYRSRGTSKFCGKYHFTPPPQLQDLVHCIRGSPH